ncbi:hypothetical protein COMA1_20687 [Candidatus Nitrospira nitrosa]|uniref:Uncharacterized protein n=1 Tax=Candidatus Nitrospira nitrosa TaxID=1742972 RepID=A0A0S4LJR6_9BACT|nr:hypothetical protein COMA1_20687 [Candidatus Nitrospira nitrosa]
MYHNGYALNPIGFYFLKHQHFERIYLYVFVISIHLLGVHLPQMSQRHNRNVRA